MSSRLFNDVHARFESSGLRGLFSPRKPRNMWLRVLLGLVGVALLAVLLVIGLFVGAGMILFGLLRHLLRQKQVPQAGRRAGTLDAEYHVVSKPGQQALR